MLIEFSVENFRSIKEKVTLSMVASNRDKSLEENLISLQNDEKFNLLKSAAIYGANASGKTNIIRAIHFMIEFVKTSHENQNMIESLLTPFLLDAEWEKKPTSFEIALFHKDIKYLYGFSLNKKSIVEEYLYYYPNKRRSIIFERKKDKFRFTKDKEEQQQLSNRTSKNVLYLSASAQWNYQKTIEIFEEIKNIEVISSFSLFQPELIRKTTKSAMKEKDKIVKFLSKADLGIHGIEASMKKVSKDDFEGLPEELVSILTKTDREIPKIKVAHDMVSGNKRIKRYFDFSDESDGTKKIYALAGPWIHALENGGAIIIDELDVRLHPLLVEYLVKMFNSYENKKGAQVIFTTHNTYILNKSLLREDQIWFTEKKKDQSTDLYSLYDLVGVRDKNIEKGYLLGRYGAIPLINYY